MTDRKQARTLNQGLMHHSTSFYDLLIGYKFVKDNGVKQKDQVSEIEVAGDRQCIGFIFLLMHTPLIHTFSDSPPPFSCS